MQGGLRRLDRDATFRNVNSLSYSKVGVSLTKHFESDGGPKLQAFWDKTGKVWTIGYGHTGSDVWEGLVWTKDQCEAALIADVRHAVNIVNKYTNIVLKQNQFDALVDFAFNAGSGAFINSTLLRLINNGEFSAAKLEFARWVKSGGHKLPGLVARRAAEANLFVSAA